MVIILMERHSLYKKYDTIYADEIADSAETQAHMFKWVTRTCTLQQ